MTFLLGLGVVGMVGGPGDAVGTDPSVEKNDNHSSCTRDQINRSFFS